ncbi:hypothetical protein [Bacillus sp. FJAT-28004]|uniref:hypothetical protein n=1 Tax=Bacillus sp. FJAT-28004 TaxID=1679165 RepID=UPI00128FC149|nr:hypothetical protein [Bacillus sp. FJAT-28004]
MSYRIDKGIIHSVEGLPHAPRWFSDGRLAVQYDEEGISQIDYFNPDATNNARTVYIRKVFDGIRFLANSGSSILRPNYQNVSLYPFGYEAEWQESRVHIEHALYTVEDAIILRFKVCECKEPSVKIQLTTYEVNGLIGCDPVDWRYLNRKYERTWSPWIFESDVSMLQGKLLDRPTKMYEGHKHVTNESLVEEVSDEEIPLYFHIGSNVDIHRPRNHILETGDLKAGDEVVFVMTFNPNMMKGQQECRRLCNDAQDAIDQQHMRYREVASRMPVLKSPYSQLNDFFALAPMYHESLKAPAHPGAIRAKSTYYWVWGWDGMTSNQATNYWGDSAFLKDMLEFYEETAHPDKGIGLFFNYDMSLASISSPPSQGMYICLLQYYFTDTGDEETVRNRYGFAKKIFNMIVNLEVGDTGFGKGTSMFPDYPNYMKQTGNDLSSFNNTIFYCAVRSMEYLADVVGDLETRKLAETMFRKMEQHFLPLFHDEDKGFIVSSVDATTLEKRNCFNSNSVKWENSYCRDLIEPTLEANLSFFEKNIVSKAGLREIPVWDDAYDRDGNQLHCWWPVTGEYYMQLINHHNRTDLMEQWIGWVGYWTGKLLCPEGISCYIDTEEPELDRWNCLSGTWQGYSMRGWYQAAVHGIVGIESEAGGLCLKPSSVEALALYGLHYRGHIYDIELLGEGSFIDTIEAHGKVYKGTCKIPSEVYQHSGVIKVHRTNVKSSSLQLQSANGMELSEFEYTDGHIRVKIKGYGTSRIRVNADAEPVCMIDGQHVKVQFNSGRKAAVVDVLLPDHGYHELSILLEK